MKVLSIFLSASPLLIPSYSQMTLGGPGIDVQEYIYRTPDYKVFELGYYYKYEIHGYYGRTDADQVENTYVDADDYIRELVEDVIRLKTSNKQGSKTKGWVHAAVTLNDARYPRKMNFQANKSHDNTGDEIYTGPVISQTDDDIEVGFYMNGNTEDPDGYMVIFGAVVKNAPKPEGSLTIDNLILYDTDQLETTEDGHTGIFIDVGYEIEKDDSTDEFEFEWDPSMWQQELSDPTAN